MPLKRILIVVFLMCLFTPFVSNAMENVAFDRAVGRDIRYRLVESRRTGQFSCHGEMICGISLIPAFYEKRNYSPAWMGDDGYFPKAQPLIEAIGEAKRQGLDSRNYHLEAIERLLKKITGEKKHRPDPVMYADFDVLLTDAFLFLGSHLVSGRVNPEIIHSSWEAFSPHVDLAGMLEKALQTGRLKETLNALSPRHPGYKGLRRALTEYRKLSENGGWPVLAGGESLTPGMVDVRVKGLKRRLILSGDMAGEDFRDGPIYDDLLEKGIRRFQQRHGLDEDGVVGRKTLAALNVPVEDRIRQIELNMERWRWIPRDLGKRHILVNIADFSLKMVENEETVMTLRVIVGRPYRKTPVFSEKMTFLVINPYWNIPRSIAVKDVVPKACENLSYLKERKIRVLEHWGATAQEIDPGAIDWCNLDGKTFGYRLRQEPGPLNSLGRIKFIFPNPYAVYLHDTPDKRLFERVLRDYSSGCIRVENPIELAALVLKNQVGWTRGDLTAAIEAGERRVILLAEPVSVHLLYLTSWVDHRGEIYFADDVYDRDRFLHMALKEKPPRKFEKAGKG